MELAGERRAGDRMSGAFATLAMIGSALIGAGIATSAAVKAARQDRLYWQSRAWDQGFVAGQEAGPDRDGANPYFEELTGRSDD